MAESEYDFDNFLSDTTDQSEPEEQPADTKDFQQGEDPPKEGGSGDDNSKTDSIRIEARSGRTTPFAVQLHKRDQEIIRAVCDAEGITQRRFIQYLMDGFLKGKKEQVRLAIKKYREKNRKDKNS